MLQPLKDKLNRWHAEARWGTATAKFLTLLNFVELKRTLRSGTEGWWRKIYLGGLALFYLQFLLILVSLLDTWWQGPRVVVAAGSFVMLSLVATLVVLIPGVEASVWLGRRFYKKTWILDSMTALTRFPIIVWVLILVPALPTAPLPRLVLYWFLILALVSGWSIAEIAREVADQAKSDYVNSLRNLGFEEDVIFRKHILVGGFREFVVAHIFDLWIQLLLIELAMGFGVRYAETLTNYPNLAPHGNSFGYVLAKTLERTHEFQHVNLVGQLGPALLLLLMFLSYWLVQIGILHLRQAGGIEYLRALSNRGNSGN